MEGLEVGFGPLADRGASPFIVREPVGTATISGGGHSSRKAKWLLLRLMANNKTSAIFPRSNHGEVFTTFREPSHRRFVWLGPHTLSRQQRLVGRRDGVQALFGFG